MNHSHLPGTTETSLDLVTNEKHVMFLADLGAFGKVAIIWDVDTTFQHVPSAGTMEPWSPDRDSGRREDL